MLFVAAAAALICIAYRWTRCKAPINLPRAGKPGFIGYISTALRYTVNAEAVLAEASENFQGRPFLVPTLSGTDVVLGAEYVEMLRSSNDTVFSQPASIQETLQLDHTMNPQQLGNPFQLTVTRTNVTRAVPSYIPEILEETTLAMEATFKPLHGSKSVSLPVFHTMTSLVGRISNRAMLGIELCRNESYIRAAVKFAETLVIYARVLRYFPLILRPTVYFMLSSVFGGPKKPTKFIVPYIQRRIHMHPETGEGLNTIADFLIQKAPPEESTEGIAMRVLNLTFGSIHTSSIFMSQVLYELASMSASDLDSIRAEVTQAVELEGGWNKAALAKFWKIDSVLREVGRFHGLGILGMGRRTIRDGDLQDGSVIPAGYQVYVNLKEVHFGPEYPNPYIFDPFRFSKLRKDEESDIKYAFTTVDNSYLPFGAGRHACPGRFFAAMELKVMIAHLLLNYDISFPDGVTGRPKNLAIDAGVIPDTKAHLVFSPRSSGKSL